MAGHNKIIDEHGNIWKRDKAAERVGNGHWDVELKDGNHLNVNGDDVENPGELNHGKEK
jgi:coenzyme F420-reducing hydrogenase beta subunit